MPQVIVYDLDDTLYPEREFAYSGFNVVDTWLRENRSIEGFQAIARQLYQEGHRGKIFNIAFERMGLDFERSVIEQMVQEYRKHMPTLQLYPDAVKVIEYFKKSKHQAIITDGTQVVQRNKIKALGLEKVIPCIIVTDELGPQHSKPSPLPYQKVTEYYKTSPSDCIYIGDNPQKDFVTAKKLGWKTIRIKRPEGTHYNTSTDTEHEADKEISSLLELI